MELFIIVLTILISLILVIRIEEKYRKLRESKFCLKYFLISFLLGLILIILKGFGFLFSPFQFYLLAPLILIGLMKVSDQVFLRFKNRNFLFYIRGIQLTENEKEIIDNDDKIASLSIHFLIIVIPLILGFLTYDLKVINNTKDTKYLTIGEKAKTELLSFPDKVQVVSISPKSKKIFYGSLNFKKRIKEKGFLEMNMYEKINENFLLIDSSKCKIETLVLFDWKIMIE